MTFDEIESRYRAAVLTADDAGGDEWDDPEQPDTDDELGYRDVDEEHSSDESPGDQGEGEE